MKYRRTWIVVASLALALVVPMVALAETVMCESDIFARGTQRRAIITKSCSFISKCADSRDVKVYGYCTAGAARHRQFTIDILNDEEHLVCESELKSETALRGLFMHYDYDVVESKPAPIECGSWCNSGSFALGIPPCSSGKWTPYKQFLVRKQRVD